MLHHRYLYALCVASELLISAAGDIYRLPAFDTVQIDNLLNNEATVVITPSVDGSYYLNASMPGTTLACLTRHGMSCMQLLDYMPGFSSAHREH